MKCTLAFIFLTFLSFKTSAQLATSADDLKKLSGNIRFVKDSTEYILSPAKSLKFLGDTVQFTGKVAAVQIIDKQKAQLLFGADRKKRKFVIILTGDRAGVRGGKLKGKMVSATGVLRNIHTIPTLLVDNDRFPIYTLRVADPGCKCQTGDPNDPIIIE